MSSIELGNYEIEENSDGTLTIERLSDGKTVTIDGDEMDLDKATISALSNSPKNGTSDKIEQRHHFDALVEGYAVGWASDYSVVIDPRDYDSDAAALQAVNDDLVSELPDSSTAEVWVPGYHPNGGSYEISSTVVFGDPNGNTRIVPQGFGMYGHDNAEINITINDGSPAFQITNSGSFNLGQPIFGNLSLNAQENDCEGLRLSDVVQFGLNNVTLKNFVGGANDGALVIDGACYNSWVDNVRWSGVDGTAYAISLVNDTGTDSPGEIRWRDGINISKGGFARAWSCEVNASKQYWNGRVEGAQGDAQFYQTDGQLIFGPHAEIGAASANHHVYFAGTSLTIPDNTFFGFNDVGDGIYIDTDDIEAYIGQQSFMSPNISGDHITIVQDPGDNNHIAVPRESQVSNNITLNYPAKGWTGIHYLDGWQPQSEGTVTVSAGGREEAVRYGPGVDEGEVRVNWQIINNPQSETRVEERIGTWPDTAQHRLEFEELAGNESVDIKWVFEQRSN